MRPSTITVSILVGCVSRHQRLVGIAGGRHVDVGGADQDDVGPLAGRQRAGLGRNPKIDGTVERGKLNETLQRQGILLPMRC